jgi:hypothetical protein
MISYEVFRANALSSLALLKDKPKYKFPPNHWSKDDIETWVKSEYERHYLRELEEVN